MGPLRSSWFDYYEKVFHYIVQTPEHQYHEDATDEYLSLCYLRIFATAELMDMDCACISPEEGSLYSGRGQPVSFQEAFVQPPNKFYEFTVDEGSSFWFALHGRLLDRAKLTPVIAVNSMALTSTRRSQHQHRWVLLRWLNAAVAKEGVFWRAEL